MEKDLKHGALFAGIGGNELGAKWAGIETIWNCENATFKRKLLKQKFPNVEQYDDIRTMSNPKWCDIISGGFPCQDISIGGKGEGIEGSRSRLWYEMRRIIREVRPNYVIIENSSALTFRGLGRVLYDLSEIGYDAEWQCLSAKAFGLQHGRERIFIIAYTHEIGQKYGGEISVFRQFDISKQFERVFPKWRERRDVPQPTNFRTANVLPNQLDRVGALGDAVIPLISFYLFECIRLHYCG